MTDKKNTDRQSVCVLCGKRMSFKTSYGEIKWHQSHVVDDGLYCQECFIKHKSGGKPARKRRS